jgi:hypothetical protein
MKAIYKEDVRFLSCFFFVSKQNIKDFTSSAETRPNKSKAPDNVKKRMLMKVKRKLSRK